MTGSKLQWLLNGSSAFIDYGRFILLVVVLIFLGLEYRLPSWPRYRRACLATAVFLINAAVFLDLLWALTSTLMICRKVLYQY